MVFTREYLKTPIRVAGLYNAWVGGCSLAGISGLNLAGGIDVCGL
jgi:hypothetical protein